MNSWNERLRIVRGRLGLDQEEMGRKLGVSREWISKLERGRETPSRELQELLVAMEQHKKVLISEPYPHLNSGGFSGRVEEERAPYGGGVASRIPLEKRMPARADCEAWLQHLLDAAEAEGSPENIPVIYHRLKKQFPLEEWDKKEP